LQLRIAALVQGKYAARHRGVVNRASAWMSGGVARHSVV
jgi:hypothetical protein